MATRFRSLFAWLVPGWLSEGEGGRVLHALSLMIDAQTQRVRDSLTARLPHEAGDSALRLIGADRGIMRGRSETTEHYADRLVSWRYPRGHRVRGSAFALLEQISEYWGGIAAESVDASGNRFSRSADGTESKTTGAWIWDDEPGWSRFWLLIDGRGLLSEHATLEEASEDDATLTAGATPGDVDAMRRLLHGRLAWRPAGTRAEWLVVLTSTAPAALAPDATWQHWSRADGSDRVQTRDGGALYWSLTPEINTYSGIAQWTSVPSVEGVPYAGDSASWPAIPLVGGGTYDGTPDWRDLQLIDDGD